MADRIVQLKDKDGNKVFPLAKGLGEKTVGTNSIKDAAVTSSKIDWATTIDWQESTESFTSDGVTFWKGPQYIKMANGLMVVYGITTNYSVPANSYKDWNVSISTPFLKTPVVLVGLTSDSTGVNFGSISCSNNYSTTNTIKLRVFNNSSSPRYPIISYIAIGRWK